MPLLEAALATVLAGVLAAVLVGVPVSSALAAPGSPGDDEVAAARSEHDRAAAEVARIGDLVARAEEDLARVTVEAEAAADASLVAQAELARAEADASRAAAELAEATAAVARTRDDVATLGREAYMSGDALSDAAVLLDAEGPGEVLQRAATLEWVGDDRAERLEQLELVELRQQRADRAARAAVVERDQAARAAAEAQAAADAKLAATQQAYDGLAAEKATLDAQLRAAEVALLEAQGVRDAEAAWARQQQAEQDRQAQAVDANGTAATRALAGSGGAVAPTSGRVSSCYGGRWGTMHYGVDIAAPVGTPVYAPQDGRVLQSGPASGFGLAVYVEHDDGTISLYGHVNQSFVSAGQLVSAGEQIAEVGNRGQSTGPHLHFEVHTGGLYRNRANPTPWLESRGISLGAC